MAPALSRLTSQGQVSVPARIRRKLGVGPGSILEWDDRSEQVVIRRAGRQDQAAPTLGFSDCLVLEVALKAGHWPLGTFDRHLGEGEGAQRLS